MDITLSHTVYALARLAGVSDPDSTDSPGANWLTLVASTAQEIIEDADQDAHFDDLRDDITEQADALVPTYTHNKWQVFVDLAAYQEDVSEWDGSGFDIGRLADLALYTIAERLLTSLVEEAITQRDDEEDTEDDDE